MDRTVIRVLPALAIALLIASPGAAAAQADTTAVVRAQALPSRCVRIASTRQTVSDEAKIAAQDLAGRAQSASIIGDNATAMGMYQRAAGLDPTDATIAYALGREYEAAHDARALMEYCRFLALNPGAAEAPDVRQRIAAIGLTLPPDTTIVRIPASASMPSPAAAFGVGLLIPGLGQFATHQPIGGVVVLALTGGAVAYGLQSQTVTSQVTKTATDPFGHQYQYQTTETHTERPNAAVGFGAAAALSLLSAIQAFTHAQSNHVQGNNSRSMAVAGSAPPHSASPIFSFAERSVGLGLAFY